MRPASCPVTVMTRNELCPVSSSRNAFIMAENKTKGEAAEPEPI